MEKVRIRHGDHEIELEGSETFIRKQLESFYQKIHMTTAGVPVTLKKDIQTGVGKKTPGQIPSPAEFYRAKNRTDGVSQILILAKYLEEYRGKSDFTRQEVNDVAAEAKFSKDIHGQYFTNAVKQGLLRGLGGGKYSLTLSAEEALSSMK
jgi:hypothetical protein